MQEAEAEASTDPEPRCRLCLQWTDKDDADCGLQNIFTEDDGNLPFNIRTCLEVYVSPEDSIRTICTNCRQTVSLIDEFRSMCRQTEEIYESVQIRCEDSGRWERYGEYVGELRKLIQEHKDTINAQLAALEAEEGMADEDSISQHFVPMQLVKEEVEEDWDDEPMAMEILEIKTEWPPSDESDEEVDENNEARPVEGIGSTSYAQQVKLAQEVLKRLEHFTSNVGDHKQLWAKIAEQMGMEYSATRILWDGMKRSYAATEEGIATDTQLKDCTLFNLMKQIDSVEPWVTPESVDTDERTHGKSLPIGLKIAIAEEIRKSPELWIRSLAGSTHTMDQIWKSIARKFNMDVTKLRLHWRTLQALYRRHKKRVREGAKVRTKTDKQFYKLIEIMQHIYQKNEAEVVKQEQVVEQSMVEEENVLNVLKGHQVDKDAEDTTENYADNPVYCQKMTLAKLVYKHQHLWNQKHNDFHNAIAKDATWDCIAVTLNKTREETKYAWKCLREMYRVRVKRLKQRQLRPDARVLHEPLFKQLELIFAENMRIGPVPPATEPPPEAPKVSEQKTDESGSDEAPEDYGDGDTDECEGDENMKLAVLCEKHEIIWNSSIIGHTNLEKKDTAWDSIARDMNLTRAQTKAMWKRLRNVYRNRRLRLLKGDLAKNSHLLRDPLYRKLDKMLKEHMQLGKNGGGINKSESSEQTTTTGKGDAGPFPTMEHKVRLVVEVSKHEFLWNATHPDYFKSDKRGATWTQIAGMFDNCDAFAAKSEWRRLRDMHRPRKSLAAAVNEPIDDNEDDEPPSSIRLYELFSNMVESLTAETEGDPVEKGESSGAMDTKKVKKRRMQEITEAYMTHKRRYTGKKCFDDEGCIKVTKGGIVRYEKVCELCGKLIERSYFEYHMNQHYGLKPYVCAIEGCGRQYGNKITRDRHEVLVHCDDGYKYECDQCDEKFKYRSTFDYHCAIKHISQQVPCTVCGKLLKHRTLLREHMRRHAGHFPCKVCGKILQQKYSLDVHMRTHTNEKPYPCEICGQCFMLKVQMKTHLAKIHQLSWEKFQESYGSTSQQ